MRSFGFLIRLLACPGLADLVFSVLVLAVMIDLLLWLVNINTMAGSSSIFSSLGKDADDSMPFSRDVN